MTTIDEAKARRDAARDLVLDEFRYRSTRADQRRAIDAFAAAERELVLEQICVWLDGAPARMAEQMKHGATSLHPMYDAGQLAAVAQTAESIRSGRWR